MKRERTVGYEVRMLGNLIRRHVENSEVKRYVDKMTGIHGWVIGYLYDHRDTDIYQKNFEDEFQIRRSTATEIIKVMEKNGLITKERVENDGRLRKLVLTEKAARYHEAFSEYLERFEKGLIRGISDEEMNVFFSVIDKIKRNIDDCD